MQCVDPRTGKVGSFLFSGESHRLCSNIHSPRFVGVMELHQWAAGAGFKSKGPFYIK